MAMESSYVTDMLPVGDFEKISVSTAVGCTASKVTINQDHGRFKRAVKVFITVETDSIRIRVDGVDPDSTTGHLFVSGSSFTITGEQNISNLRMIKVTNTATVQVSYTYNT